MSPRGQKPFGTLHGGLLRPDLLRSELFGHRKGAFTGALSNQTGLLTRVHEGTAFLDEVGDLLPEGQLALLRFLDSGELLPLGEETPSHSGARIVAATNRPLRAAIRAGQFREDLYHRLSVGILRVPPLRARLDDLPLLVEHARRKAAERYGPAVGAPSPEALAWLMTQPWPGNVRELVALLRRAWMPRRRGPLELQHLVAAAEAEDDPAEDGPPAGTEDRTPPTRVAVGAEAPAASGPSAPSGPRAVAPALPDCGSRQRRRPRPPSVRHHLCPARLAVPGPPPAPAPWCRASG